MSLILEALRRSEAQRRSGRPPALHDPSLPPARQSERPRLAIGIGLGLAVGIGLWLVFDRHTGSAASPSQADDHADDRAADAATASGAGDYTLIVIDGAIEQLPEGLATRLAEGGRIATGLVLRQVTRLAFGRKVAGQVNLQPVEDLGIPVLHAFDAPRGWTFA